MLLTEVVKNTRTGHYAVGSFSPRYLRAIRPVLLAAQAKNSPIIVQVSQRELGRYHATPAQFAERHRALLKELAISVPVTLHLDHTKDFAFIKDAIEQGFESVMIDASELSLEENISITREVVEYAHQRGANVEAELGKIASNDQIETDGDDSELYTDPREAGYFVEKTGVDALAISVGTAHGAYIAKKPRVDTGRIREIRAYTDIPLVLHGASGVPAEMIHRATELDCGGVSKVNIATDLETAFLKSLGLDHPLTNETVGDCAPDALERAWNAVQETVEIKIRDFVRSENKAW